MEEGNKERHVMVLDTTYDSGSEAWCCRLCGRSLLIQWEPSFNMMIIDVGDENAMHCGAKGGISVQSAQITPENGIGEDAPQLSEQEEERLQPWLDWMEKTQFDNLWGEEDQQ